jgi:hypothetical protein
VLLDLGKQRQLVEAASQALIVDQDLDLFQLAQQMQSVTLDSITFQTVPYIGDDRTDGVGSIVRLEDEETLHQSFAQLSAEPEAPAETPAEAPATVDPSTVSVLVLNGSRISGLAVSAKGELQAAGFTVTGTGNADDADHTQTLVRYTTGDEAQAASVAAQIAGSVTEVDDTLTPGTVQLVLGSDFNGVGVPTTAEPAPDEAVGEDVTEYRPGGFTADATDPPAAGWLQSSRRAPRSGALMSPVPGVPSASP